LWNRIIYIAMHIQFLFAKQLETKERLAYSNPKTIEKRTEAYAKKSARRGCFCWHWEQ